VPLMRDEVARHVGSAFIGGAASRTDLVALARARRAPEDVIRVLRSLPDRRFEHLYEVLDLLSGSAQPTLSETTPTVPARDLVGAA
jgi:hypothetical protein